MDVIRDITGARRSTSWGLLGGALSMMTATYLEERRRRGQQSTLLKRWSTSRSRGLGVLNDEAPVAKLERKLASVVTRGERWGPLT